MDVSPVDPVHSEDTEGMIYDATYKGYGFPSNGYFWTDLGHYEVRDADGHIVTGLYTPFFYHTNTSVWDPSKGYYNPVHKGDGSEMLCEESMSNITVGEMDRVLKALYQNDLSVYQAINGTIGEDGEQVEGIKQKLFTKVVAADLGNGKTKYDYESESGKVIGTSYDTNTTYSAVRTNGAQNTNQVSVYTITDSNGEKLAEIIDTDTKYTAGKGIVINGTEISATGEDTNTQYSVKSTTKTGSTVTEYDIVDASDETKSIGKIVDTNTKYTVSAAAGTGNVVNTYTLTDSDGNALTQIVDTDTNTTYEVARRNGAQNTNQVSVYTITDSNGAQLAEIIDTDTKYTAGNGIAINGTEISTTVVDTNTQYSVKSTTKTGSTVTEYDIVDASDETKSIGKIVDTNTKYTVSAAAGTGNVVNTYTLTDSDGNALTQIVDTDTTYTAVRTNGASNTNQVSVYTITDSNGEKLAEIIDTDTKYTAGNGIAISDTNVISVDGTAIAGATSLKYRANGSTTVQSVTLAQGLNFVNGSNTTASVAVNGEVKYDLNKDVTLADGSLKVTGADGNVLIQNGTITGNGYGLNNDGSVSFANGSFSIASNGNITSSFGNGGHILADNNGFGVSQGNSTLAVTNDGVGLSKTNEDGVKSAVAVTDNGVGITSGESALVVGAGGTVIKGGLDMMNEKITGVAAGEADTDAVNVSQLKAAAAAANTKVEEGKNIDVTSTTAEDGSKTYTVALEKDVELEDGSLTVTGTAGNVVIQNGAITGPNYALNADGSVSFANGNFSIASNGNISSSFGNGGHILADNNGFGVSQGNSILAVTNDGVAASKGDSALAVTEGGVGITSGDSALVVGESGTVIKGGLDMMNEKITGVAAGEISKTSTDAVNGSQLKHVQDQVDAIDGRVTTIESDITEIKGDINHINNRVTQVEAIAGKHTTVTTAESEKNLTISEGTNDAGGKEYSITINRGMDLDSVTTGNTVMSNDGISFKDSDTKLTSSGLTVGDTIVDGDGISIKTEEGKETYITKDGINANDKKITNVADGDVSKDSTDAVNGSQLHATNEYISNVANQVADNSSRINKLGRRVDKVGAGSAALAALHPLDFDPDDKLTFSAGVGNYHGQNAAAIGAFYRPTEKIMVSVGGTVGNDENMVNAGISFALDRTNNVSNSRTAMAREIVDLRAQVANLTALVNKLISDKTGADPAAMFPDVPANHWAYEYINGLAMQGIIEGYPDGTFQGEATMTRYEFATMLFKAMEKGAVLSDRLREEFKNELGRIRVDRIKGDDNDAGKIERVRVNEGADRDDYGTKLQAQG